MSFPEVLSITRKLPAGLFVPSLAFLVLGCGRDDAGGDTPPAETGTVACSNQVDDDGDGQIDFLEFAKAAGACLYVRVARARVIPMMPSLPSYSSTPDMIWGWSPSRWRCC